MTDFGEKGSHYVAAMKSIIFQINSEVKIIDINHNISPYSISEANFLIYYALQNFPPESIIICVVDPGVGTKRDLLAVKTKKSIIVIGPNNGIFSLLSSMSEIDQIVKIENESLYKQKQEISYTFHGRDIMAPIAAKLSLGIPFNQVGPQIKEQDLIINHTMQKSLFRNESMAELTALYIDSFGNIITNLHKTEFKNHVIKENRKIEIIKPIRSQVSIANTFAELKENEIGFIGGSSEFMEICLKNKSASEVLNIKPGDRMQIQLI